MPVNWIAVLGSALIPLLVGFVWYNPKVFGKAWMAASNITDEDVKKSNMALIFGLSLVFSLMMAMMTMPFVIHQIHVGSILMKDPGFGQKGSKVMLWLADFMKQHGDKYRTFGHGAIHGGLLGVFLITPALATHALYERKGFKYILINGGYWTVSLALMGAVICGWR